VQATGILGHHGNPAGFHGVTLGFLLHGFASPNGQMTAQLAELRQRTD